MINLTRQTLFPWGTSAPGNAFSVIGSTAAGSTAYASGADDLVTMQTGGGAGATSQYLNGLFGAGGPLVGNGSPVATDFNSLLALAINTCAYLQQKGIAKYDAGTTYYTGDVCNYGSPLVPYQSLVDNNTGNTPASSLTQWVPWANVFGGLGICKAWATYDAVTNSLYKAFNINSITKSSTGIYVANIASGIMADNYYSVTGSCGTPNGIPAITGDEYNISTGFQGQTGLRTQTQFRFFCSLGSNLADSSMVSLQVFGN